MTIPSPCVLFDDSLSGAARLYRAPREVVTAWRADEVAAAFARLESLRARGLHLAGCASYELGRVLEPKLAPLRRRDARAPLMSFGAFDGPAPQAEARAMIGAADAGAGRAAMTAPVADWTLADYAARFDAVRRYICAGDIYQANLTFALRARALSGPLELYGAMRARQPVRYGGIVDLDGPRLLCASPELFFEVDAGGWIEARPMKGTAARGADAAQDARFRAWLAADPKNRAENLMIVDLLRNDIGRVAQIGSVSASELFTVETYPTLFQMVSRVRGRLRRRLTVGELFAGLFPCGSITGAPKVRAMEIIHELESVPRGAYCGAIGYIEPGGAMRFNVAIRTLSLHRDGEAVYNVGSGLVHDSEAASEYEECLLKARFLTNAARISA